MVNKLKLFKHANKDVHFEVNAGEIKSEIEVYVGGWFLCSVDINNISDEAKDYIFEDNKQDEAI